MVDNNTTTPVPPPAAAGAESVEKSKNADKNEAKRLAKLEKFLAKQKAAAEKTKVIPTAKEGKKAKREKTAATPEPEFVNTTPKGEKKDMSKPMAATYNPKA
ncbi:hypothetical protein BGX24_005726, partial [Mortierella sp. AD032]